MARQIRPLAQKVAGARIQAPSAPSAPRAPAVRNFQGSMAAGASASSYGAKTITPNSNKPASANTPSKPGGDNPISTVPKQTQPKPTGPQAPPDPRDSTYWNNVAALQQQFGNEKAAIIAEGARADVGYRQEGERMSTNREHARRNLAESLLGSGSIYSGMHRRQQVEGDTDYLLDRDRLNSDYRAGQAERRTRWADAQSRLAPLTGTDWQQAMIDAQNRYNEGKQKQVEEGAPVGKLPGLGHQIKNANGKIARLRKKAKATNNPKLEKKLRGKIQATRKHRDQLVRKWKAKNGSKN